MNISVSEVKLIDIVQKMMSNYYLKLGKWSCSRIAWKASNYVTGGLYRVAGTAWSNEEAVHWSLILKVVVPAIQADDPQHYNYWKREVLAYQSGILEQLPEMIRAPRCLAVEEQDDHTIWLWLEEVTDRIGAEWTGQQYEEVVRLLGRFNGAYLCGVPLPDEAWLCKGWLASWVEECDKYDDRSVLNEEAWEIPILKGLFPTNIVRRYKEFYRTRGLLLKGLQRLPRVLTHNDAWPPNLFPQGKDSLIAIDWAFVGIAGLGEELGRLYGLLLHSSVDTAAAVATRNDFLNRLLDSYIAGIREAGWDGDSDWVRFGFTASAGMRCGMVIPKLIEQINKKKDEELLTDEMKARCNIAVHLLELAEEASLLLPKILGGRRS
ncbi:phosphotransferase [Paenibacillus foliorum]|uniref:phosphotransferase n=1 Tax=Paenibacillus foliorum TaxID=2654974 RepID=UPI001490C373|nr:phosphotransferase [Paenibacillus foliorum]